jgi:hypothetical protein
MMCPPGSRTTIVTSGAAGTSAPLPHPRIGLGYGEEVGTAMGHSLSIHYTGVSVMFGIALFTLWLLLAGYSIKDLSARAILTITGHLRARPDPWLESALRTAFTEFDRELALIMQDSHESAAGSADPPLPGIV